jgi:hypothetical protein
VPAQSRPSTVAQGALLRDQLTETEFRSCIGKGEELDGAQVIDSALDAIARAAPNQPPRPTLYQFGRDIPAKSDAEVVITDKE